MNVPKLLVMRHIRSFPLSRAVAVLVLLGVSVFAALPSVAQDSESSGYQRVLDITVPLPPDTYGELYDSFFASRGGGTRIHHAIDLMADYMVPIYAAASGTVCYITGMDDNPPSYGYYLKICGDDGLEYQYVHINEDTPGTQDGQGGAANAYAPGVVDGARVERGQHVAWVGDSGNTEGVPHLHFAIRDSEQAEHDGYINPYHSLQAAEERGDYSDNPAPMPAPSEPDEPVSETPTEEPTEGHVDDPVDEPTDEPVGEPTAEPEAAVNRLAGSTRITTAIALSQRGWTAASRAVVIVPADSHVEALVAAPLAGLIDSPILLNGPDGLDADVLEEIRRLKPISAYVIGDTDQLSEDVEADLDAAGVSNWARLSAPNRYALSALVAEEIASYENDPSIDEVIIALGDAAESSRAWPDALSASAWAARTSVPVLLTEGDRLPDEVADLLTAFRPSMVTVVGGTAAIAESTAEEAAELADADLVRLAGATRYATSAAVAEAARQAGLTASDVWVATGLNFPDALAAGPAAARLGSPLVLVDGLNPDGAPDSAVWLHDNADDVVVVGGPAVVTDDVARALLR